MGNYIPHFKSDEVGSKILSKVSKLFRGSGPKYPLCSRCFVSQGLRLDAETIGIADKAACANCASTLGRKLDNRLIATLAHRFFVLGSFHKCEYGAAPVVQFNHQQTTDINMCQWFEDDLHLIERTINVGFFYYGPRLWMVGEVEPLKALESDEARKVILERILREYPVKVLKSGESFYRLRVGPAAPENGDEYDSPPKPSDNPGRLDSAELRIMYGSQDLQVCIHECRVTADDDVYVATLAPKQDLKLLDLTELLTEEQVTEFESLDMAVHMLFLAGKHSYPIARELALAAQRGGFDGVLYPSYFSMLRSGGIPFETLTGISHRRIPKFAGRERAKIVPNIAIFGRPISDKKVEVTSINRLILARVEYEVRFGPVGYQWIDDESKDVEV